MAGRSSWRIWIVTILVGVWVAIWLFPIWNVLVSGSKSNEQYLDSNPWELPPSISAASQFLQNAQIGLIGDTSASNWGGSHAGNALLPAVANSLLYSVLSAVLAIILAALAAYSLARLPLRGRFLLFMLLFSGTIFPLQMYLVPLFRLYQDLNLYDTRLGMLLFYTAICIPFCVFVLRNWFLTIPQEIVESSQLDGCSRMQTFFYIFVPLSWGPFLTLFLFQFTWVWNDLIFGLTLARSQEARPVMTLLAGLQSMYSDIGIPPVLASAVVASLPTLILVISFQRHFFSGLAMGQAVAERRAAR